MAAEGVCGNSRRGEFGDWRRGRFLLRQGTGTAVSKQAIGRGSFFYRRRIASNGVSGKGPTTEHRREKLNQGPEWTQWKCFAGTRKKKKGISPRLPPVPEGDLDNLSDVIEPAKGGRPKNWTGNVQGTEVMEAQCNRKIALITEKIKASGYALENV